VAAPDLIFVVAAAVLLIANGASIWATLQSRRDFANGRPHIDSLRDVTGIIGRNELIARFGRPNSHDRFQVDLPTALASAKGWIRWFDSPWLDAISTAAIFSALAVARPFGWFILAAVATYSVAGWIVAAIVNWPYRHELAGED
jgi:hypothetical protein